MKDDGVRYPPTPIAISSSIHPIAKILKIFFIIPSEIKIHILKNFYRKNLKFNLTLKHICLIITNMDGISDIDTSKALSEQYKSAAEYQLSLITNTEQPLTKSELALAKRETALDKAIGKEVGSARRKLYQRLSEGLDAETEEEDYVDGKRIIKNVADMKTRRDYLELGLKVIGDLVEIKTEVNVDASSRTLQISAVEREELEKLRSQVHIVQAETKPVKRKEKTDVVGK